MSFIYSSLITGSRPNATTGIGALGYQGLLPSQETILFTDVPASIQQKSTTSQKAGIPGDAYVVAVWRILIPKYALANGSIIERDILTDQLLLKRYQIAGAYWNSLGYNVLCELLQT